MGFDRRWTDDPSSDDASGAARSSVSVLPQRWSHVRREARRLFEWVSGFRSDHPRAIARSVVGAAELFAADERCLSAPDRWSRTAGVAPRRTTSAGPPRLAYGNALLPEALIAAGHTLDDSVALDEGLRLLRWLVEGDVGRAPERHTRGQQGARRRPPGVRPAADRGGPARRRVRTRLRRDGGRRWLDALRLSVGWFEGSNDVGSRCWIIEETGGAFDSLAGVNENQGAESTIALVASAPTRREVRGVVGSRRRHGERGPAADPPGRSPRRRTSLAAPYVR